MKVKNSVLYPTLYENYNDTLSLKDLANYLNISYNTACRLLKERAIFGKRVGREWRIPRYKVVEFLEKSKR